MSTVLMLRTSSRFTLAAVIVLASGSALTLACSGDDTTNPAPPPVDGGNDATTDAAHDGATHDATPDGSNDAGTDAPVTHDASPDATQDSSTDGQAQDSSTDGQAQDSSNPDSSSDAGDTGVDGGFDMTSWMGQFPTTRSLAALSIPGTHDTGATIDAPGTTGTTKCQDLTVDAQLTAGVRYMDIRLKALDDTHFEVFHTNVDQSLTFDAVLTSIFTFFTAHPTETVVMSLKQEQGPAGGVTKSFEQIFGSYVAQHADRWYLGATVPTLADARGKIVVLRRFGATSLPTGIDVSSGWADNTTFTLANGDATLRIQDYYEITDDPSKWTAITSLFDEATQSAADAGTPPVLFLNNTSAYLPLNGGLEDIPSVSNTINPQLASYFGTAKTGRYGIVAMDFVDATKAAGIVRTNF
jgi:1-phosphatidylinositol phosphodiesterase